MPGFGDFRTWNLRTLSIYVQLSDGIQIKLPFAFLCELWSSISCVTQILLSLLIGLKFPFDCFQRTELQQTLGSSDVVMEVFVLLLYSTLGVDASPLNVFATGPALCKTWTLKHPCLAVQWSLVKQSTEAYSWEGGELVSHLYMIVGKVWSLKVICWRRKRTTVTELSILYFPSI